MKVFVITILIGIVVVGGAIVVEMTRERDDSDQVKKFVETRGDAPLPRSWVGKVGKGI